MHASSLENMLKCFNRYVSRTELEKQLTVEVLDVGGADINGTYRQIFSGTNFRYRTADTDSAAGVDVLLDDPYSFPFGDQSIDIVVSGQAFEHIEFFWRTFSEMTRVLKPDGFIFLIGPSAGPEHRYPVDCYRFYPDAFAALAKFANCELIDVWRDKRGPWHDLVGVFRHRNARKMGARSNVNRVGLSLWNGVSGSEQEEVERGNVSYLQVLDRIQQTLKPANYLEIGVRHGYSLVLAKGTAVGIDPNPDLRVVLPNTARVVVSTSDDFFDITQIIEPCDLAFIDGMHLFEFALRDFMNIERSAVAGSAVLLDDIFPNHPAQAERHRRTRLWTGDVWKLVEIIRSYRPDLYLATIDAGPTGSALVAGLDPKNRVLWDQYNSIVRRFNAIQSPPQHVIERRGALDPEGTECAMLLQRLSEIFRQRTRPSEVLPTLNEIGGSGLSMRPKLSVIIIGFNMARELPRTIRSVSPDFQKDVKASDYELILIDNGSRVPIDEKELRKLASNLRVHRMSNATVSPVPAIQYGLEMARGELVGVFIDGARLASPGLLTRALAASKIHHRAVIGTIAFHLGPKVQAESILEGYDQAVEDQLLASCHWENDGYKLFEISSLAASSAGGWFVVPAESSAVFMQATHWRELGGYDLRFVSPGGGLANLDLWARACADPQAELIMLLGEATFHQVHGGVATNALNPFWTAFQDEYIKIRGRPYECPTRQAFYFGTLPGLTSDPLQMPVTALEDNIAKRAPARRP